MADDPRVPESAPDESREAALPDNNSTDTNDGPAAGVLTRVCIECGKEYYFTGEEAPEIMVCERCGNKVFRDYFSPSNDEAARDFADSTDRDLRPDDAEGDTMEGDVLDLNRD